MWDSFIAKMALAKDVIIDRLAADSVMKKFVIQLFERKPFDNAIEMSALFVNHSEQIRYEVQRSSVFSEVVLDLHVP